MRDEIENFILNCFLINTSPSIGGRRNKNIWSQILMKFDQNFGFEDEILVLGV